MSVLQGVDTMALSWCLPEIAESVARVSDSIDRHLAAEPGMVGDLKIARIHLHQVHGALQIVGLPGVTVLVEEAEGFIDRGEQGQLTIDATAAAALKSACGAVVEYLQDLHGGATLSPVVLFPYYRALLELRKADRIDPADLYFPDLSIAAPRDDQLNAPVTGVEADALRARQDFEKGLLVFLRGDAMDPAALQAMDQAVGRMLAAHRRKAGRVFLWLSAAVLDAIKHNALPADLYVKRLFARVNIQARRTLEKGDPVADRMVKDLMFQLGRAQKEAGSLAALARRHYRLAGTVPPDFEKLRYGLVDPARLRQAREALAMLKRHWEKFVNGSREELEPFRDTSTVLLTALHSLPYRGAAELGAALTRVPSVMKGDVDGEHPLAIEVATAVLFLEDALERGLRQDPMFDERAAELAERLGRALQAPDQIDDDVPTWLAELSNQASDRMTVGVFAGELSANLRQCEQILDSYFRKPADRAVLADVIAPMTQVHGVLRSLGHDQAALACQTVIDDVRAIIEMPEAQDASAEASGADSGGGDSAAGDESAVTPPAVPSEVDQLRLANNLSALGFFVDSLAQPDGSQGSFEFDPAARELVARMSERHARRETVAITTDAEGLIVSVPDPVEPRESVEGRTAAHRAAILPWFNLLKTAPMASELHAQLGTALQALEQDAVLIDDLELKRESTQARERLARLQLGDLTVVPELALLLASINGSAAGRQAADAVLAPVVVPASAGASSITAEGASDTNSAVRAAPADTKQPASATSAGPALSDDERELHEIFLLEAGEVVGAIRDSLGELRRQPASQELLTTVRRAFHTLKGSSRMVGLKAFGEAAWAFEQLLNAWLAADRAGDAPLFALIDDGQRLFGQWVEQLQQDPFVVLDASPHIRRCDAMREGRTLSDAEALTPATAPVVVSAVVPAETAMGAKADDVPSAQAAPVVDEPLDLLDPIDPVSMLDMSMLDDEAPQTGEPLESLPVESLLVDAPPTMPAAAPGSESGADSGAWTDAPPTPDNLVELARSFGVGVPDLALDFVDTVALTEAAQELDLGHMPDAAASVGEDVAPDMATAAPVDDAMVMIGGVRPVNPQLYAVFVAEAADIRERIRTGLEEWLFAEQPSPAPHELLRALHSLVGASRHLGLGQVREVAVPAESFLERHAHTGAMVPVADFEVFERAMRSIYAMLEAFERREEPAADPSSVIAMERLVARWSDPEQWGEPAHVPTATAVPADASTPSESTQGSLFIPAESAPQAGSDASTPHDAVSDGATVMPGTGESVTAESVPGDVVHVDPVSTGSMDADPFADALSDALSPAARADGGPAGVIDADPHQPDADRSGISADEPAVRGAGQSGMPSPIDVGFDGHTGGMTGLASDALETEDVSPEAVDAAIDAVASAFGTAPVPEDDAAYAGLEDELDADLGPIFFEEADDQLASVGNVLRDWQATPDATDPPAALMRLLHTVKGSARMAGAMRLGQRLHDMETAIEEALAQQSVPAELIDRLQASHDIVMAAYERLRHPESAVAEAPAVSSPTPVSVTGSGVSKPSAPLAALAPTATTASAVNGPAAAGVAGAAGSQNAAAAQQMIRVRSDHLDRMVAESGEVSVARARLENEHAQIRQAMNELADNVSRLRTQLREIEIQADTQIQAQIAQAKDQHEEFDPLEYDRYTRFQELTRMLAESVNDVSTIQQNAMRAVEAAGQDLARQTQVSRSLQQGLMRVRMVQFGTVSDRLYRVVRQSAKDTEKRVSLEIRGAAAEVDRGVLDRMVGPIEHLLRNSVAHGIESRARRQAAGKPEKGELTVDVRHDGNEVVMRFADDGGGLDYERIEKRGREKGLIAPGRTVSERELAQLIFAPGFSTVDQSQVSMLAGRGVGMDVVRAEVSAMGGRIDIDSERGRGTVFTISLPVSLAISHVAVVGVGDTHFAVQASLVDRILQVDPDRLVEGYAGQTIEVDGERLPLHFLGTLLELPQVKPLAQRQTPVLVLRSGAGKVALHVDTVVPNQEAVIKPVGPQLARMAGVAGATVLGNGEIVLILNPVQLVQTTKAAQRPAAESEGLVVGHDVKSSVTVMVVDDSVTVRKVSQRLLVREGYIVVLAKDGVDALRQLQDVRPDVMLVDIEMPRMDGFDLTKNIRGSEEWRDIPIIMITSRTADKHRNHALSLGVDAFLGKPFVDEELLGHIQRLTARATA